VNAHAGSALSAPADAGNHGSRFLRVGHSVLIRQASRGDAAAVAAVSLAAGQPPEDSGPDVRYVDLLLTTGTVLVAEAGGGVVGWGATRPRLGASMLTDLFVHPAHHGQGIGTRLLEGLWPPTPPARWGRFTFSSLHPHALPLYVRSGLLARWPLLYLAGPAGPVPRVGLTVTAVAPERAAAAEARLVGGDTSPDAAPYRYWDGGGAPATVVVADGDDVVACGALRPGEVTHLTCARDADLVDAVDVVAAVVAAAGPEVRLCVPGPHPALPALLGWGFRIEELDLALSAGVELPASTVFSPGLG